MLVCRLLVEFLKCSMTSQNYVHVCVRECMCTWISGLCKHKTNNKIIIVLPHTSYTNIFIVNFYMLSDGDNKSVLRFLPEQCFHLSRIRNISGKNKPTQYPLQHASSFVQICYLFLVKSSDKLQKIIFHWIKSINIRQNNGKSGRAGYIIT